MRTTRGPWQPAAAVAAAALALTACGGAHGAAAGPEGEAVAAAAEPPPEPLRLTPKSAPIQVVPGDGATGAPADDGVVVTSASGALRRVVVTGGGRTVPGALSADRRTWRSTGPLAPDTSYTVASTGTDAASTSRFRTGRPAGTFRVADVTPRRGETVGVGMPMIVTFDRNIRDRAAVERALRVTMSRPVPAAWNWTGARQVVLRPKRYWPAGERVTLTAKLRGVRSAPKVTGAADVSAGFRVGASHVSVVNTRTHRMKVRVNGRVVRNAPISAGKGGTRAYTTTSGVHLAMAKADPVVMTSSWMGVTDKKDPRYYKLKVRHAVRISNSGEFVHAAPWSVASQGRANVSHGCVNAAPAFAKWYYGQTMRGDVVTVTGTNRPLEWNNGWGYWQLSWSRWLAGSALHAPVG
ncbi:L,D-transpeptidase [Actinomadura parmotrematis]|uniref:L,D-transpeptidase family protein n=1 Tax=Actinomadura parmotrematis TaxID=2864039 RepID=A0ABS7FPB3_9ACTN|nr:Ig-like domain-containing protein [Actinomadura parmotrematis]MBW8482209.1 L,D-transpeptidase family protein [Actinomadura parmotrematis]